MSDADWGVIFKKLYWDAELGDQINSQRIADITVDFLWASGKHNPERDVQDILIHSFGAHIAEDGNFGSQTIAAINAANEQQLFDDIVAKRYRYFQQCVANNPADSQFINGWNNRIKNLVKFETT